MSGPGNIAISKKGVVWVNGFNLGRYWSRGPQRTLFVPGAQLIAGQNELVVFETAARSRDEVRFVPQLMLGPEEE